MPIETAQWVIQDDIESKPVAVHQGSVLCSSCAGPLPDTVTATVLVDSRGRVMDVQTMAGRRWVAGALRPQLDAPALAIIREAVRQWKFTPARARGQYVNDWVYVDVALRR